MKKVILLLLLQFLLTACAVLLIGCGGHRQDNQQGITVINQPKQETCSD